MARNPEYQFVSTDVEELVAELVTGYEGLTGVAVRPASPEKLFIMWVASVILRERVQHNHTANQNIPSRAEGASLDALGELFYAQKRQAATAAVCTMRFAISEAQEGAVLIPAGTRITDRNRELVWETVQDVFVPAGETYALALARCQTAGVAGNGYAAGQICRIIDLYDYFVACENMTVSDGGSDEATDEEYYQLMVQSMDAWSCAGARGAYTYFAKQVSTEIADVLPVSPEPGYVKIYTLMDDGTLASEEIKTAVVAACSPDNVRAMGDLVTAEDAETVPYDIELTYYLQTGSEHSAMATQIKVAAAVQEYIKWQCGKFGRDINPDKLREKLLACGVKRIELVSPAYTALSKGMDGTVPQVAAVGTVTVTSGGYEDE